MPTKQQAEQFFAELEVSSAIARAEAAGSSAFSPWGGNAWPSRTGPTGFVMHYTASNNFKGSVDWLCRPSFNAKASAHVVIGRTREAWADKGVKKGGLIDKLEASVVQIRLPSQTAWHSTWANDWAIGVELVSAGEIRQNKNGDWCGPNGDWSEKLGIADIKYGNFFGNRKWQGFTYEQSATAAVVMRHYRALFPAMVPTDLVGHEHVQGVRTPERLGCDKRDLGVGTWLDNCRDQVFLGSEENFAFHRFNGDEIEELPEVVQKLSSAEGEPPFFVQTYCLRALLLLGYAVHYPPGGVSPFDASMPANRRSLYIAQRMLGLVPDMVAGPKTIDALVWRLKDRYGV